MWYLYLDESGDLGFDFVKQNCLLQLSPAP